MPARDSGDHLAARARGHPCARRDGTCDVGAGLTCAALQPTLRHVLPAAAGAQTFRPAHTAAVSAQSPRHSVCRHCLQPLHIPCPLLAYRLGTQCPVQRKCTCRTVPHSGTYSAGASYWQWCCDRCPLLVCTVLVSSAVNSVHTSSAQCRVQFWTSAAVTCGDVQSTSLEFWSTLACC
jgi:hypothetical protein